MKFRVDIDHTILSTRFSIEKEKYEVLTENYSLIKKINRLYENNHEIVIETGRHWNHMIDTMEQLKECGIKYHTLIMGKPPSNYIIDDKAIRPDEFLKMDFEEI
jgi:hypothetical protein